MPQLSKSKILMISVLGLLAACAPKLKSPGDDCAGNACVGSAEADDAAESEIHDAPAIVPTPTTLPFVADDSAMTNGVPPGFSHLDPNRIVPQKALEDALNFFVKNKSGIRNQKYLVIIDFSKHNSKKRFYLINMVTGGVEQYLTAHGRGSDENFDGYADKFSNIEGSKMSSLGYYTTAETYQGKHGYSLRLDGLSRTNSQARSRAIVIHGADYVRDGLSPIGRSWGCPALDQRYVQSVINKIKGGTLIYAFN